MFGRSQQRCGVNQLELMQQLANWYDNERSARVLALLGTLLQQWLRRDGGFLAVELSGVPGHAAWVREGNFKSYFCVAPAGADISTRFDALPIGNESSDLVIVFHVLEFVDDSCHFLREIDRILAPRGRCVIAAFDSFGVSGMLRASSSSAEAPWCGRPYPLWRLRKRLSLLGFSIEKHARLPLPLFSGGKLWRKDVDSILPQALSWSGGLCAVYAQKQISETVIPGREPWYRSFVRSRIVQPTALEQCL